MAAEDPAIMLSRSSAVILLRHVISRKVKDGFKPLSLYLIATKNSFANNYWFFYDFSEAK